MDWLVLRQEWSGQCNILLNVDWILICLILQDPARTHWSLVISEASLEPVNDHLPGVDDEEDGHNDDDADGDADDGNDLSFVGLVVTSDTGTVDHITLETETGDVLVPDTAWTEASDHSDTGDRVTHIDSVDDDIVEEGEVAVALPNIARQVQRW